MKPSREAALALLDKARGDGRAFRALLADAEVPAWIVGFHAQQAVEKALKAVLLAASIEYPRTHNLAMLIGLLRRHSLSLPPDADELSRLTPFGTAFRYDDIMSEDSDVSLDPDWMSRCIERTVSWAEAFCADNTGL